MTSLNLVSIGGLISLLAGGVALAEGPSTADTLGKVHHANQQEIAMGKMAQNHGASAAVVAFGKVLVKDHTAADGMVAKLAKDEKINLAKVTPPLEHPGIAREYTGAAFDDAFARMMLDDHNTAVAEFTTARDSTNDPKLKKLLDELLPVLKKHQETAQKLVADGEKNTH